MILPNPQPEVYCHSPTDFILNHWRELLPGWAIAPQSLILILFPAQYPLDREDPETAMEKDRLLQQFWVWSEFLQKIAKHQGLFTETISPPTGAPQCSRVGSLTFDSVAIAHQVLGFEFNRTDKGCKLLVHPQWHTAVYPGVILSISTVANVQALLASHSILGYNDFVEGF